jgi:enoyl-CoA hydratase/carnithine racemase
MACTTRICKAGLKVIAGQPEPTLGIIPGAGGTQRMPRLIGIEKAAQMLRTGRPIGSKDAVQLGLCLEEVTGDLRARAVTLAREIAHGQRKVKPIERGAMAAVPAELPPVEIGALSKAVDQVLCRAILEGARKPLREGLALEAKCFGEICGLRDMRIGVENFLANGPKVKAAFVHA